MVCNLDHSSIQLMCGQYIHLQLMLWCNLNYHYQWCAEVNRILSKHFKYMVTLGSVQSYIFVEKFGIILKSCRINML